MSAAAPAPGLGARAALRLCVAPWAVGKVLTVAVVLLAAWQHGTGVGRPGWDELRPAFAFWDGQNYVTIAAHGYPADADPTPGAPGHLWGFLPGYSILVAGVAVLLRDVILSGVVVAAALELVALVFVARLVSAERDENAARLASWLLALAPYGVFLTAVYTESAFLAAAAASLYLLRQGRFLSACSCAALATAVRITGLALVPALLLEYGLRRRGRPGAELAGILLVPLPLVLFCAYARLHAGDALAYLHIQESASFNRGLSSPLSGLRATWDLATRQDPEPLTFVFSAEVLWGLAGLAACLALWSWRRLGAAWSPRGVAAGLAVYATGAWLLSVAQPYWLSLGRYDLALLPALIPLTDVVARHAERATALLAASAGLMVLVTTLYAQGNFVG